MQLSPPEQRILVIGYGNPGRQDDGLGPACANRIAAWQLPSVVTQDNYQLCVEDAYDIAGYQTVIFADASVAEDQVFRFAPLASGEVPQFGSHSLSPAAVVELSRSLFGADPEAYLLAIRGFEFDRFDEQLSERAEQGLEQALAFLYPWLKERVGA